METNYLWHIIFFKDDHKSTSQPKCSSAMSSCHLTFPLRGEVYFFIWLGVGTYDCFDQFWSEHLKCSGSLCFLETIYHMRIVTLWDHHAVSSPNHTERPWRMECHMRGEREVTQNTEAPDISAKMFKVGPPALPTLVDVTWVRHKPPSWVFSKFLMHKIVGKIKRLFYTTRFWYILLHSNIETHHCFRHVSVQMQN